VAGVAAGGTVAAGATTPTVLPDVLTDLATNLYPTPPDPRTLWRPTVTEAHASEAVTRLEQTVSDGQQRWDRLETDEEFLGAGGWLENARQALRRDRYHEALADATTGLQYAGEALGIARAKLGEADRERLAGRAERLRERIDRVATSVRPYPVVDPGRDLAWYYRIERDLVFARLHATPREADAAGAGDGERLDPRAVGRATADVLQGEQYVENAARFHDLLSATVGDGDTAAAGHLRRVADSFADAIDGFPTHGEVRSTFVDNEPYGPYEFARSRLARWCFDEQYRFPADESAGLLVYRTVERSKGLAQRRAHGPAFQRLVVEEDDEGFDSGHALAAKRRARATYRSVVGSEPPPLLTRQVRRAVSDLQVAKVGFGGSYQRPVWRERLQAYLYALVGRAKLQQYPAVYEALVSVD
jgi:hypothetical protein